MSLSVRDKLMGRRGRERLHAIRTRFGGRVDSSYALTRPLVIATLVSLLIIGSWALPTLDRRAISPPQTGRPASSAIATQAPVPSNATDCGLLSPSYIQGTESSQGWPPSYAQDTQIMFAKLCNDTAFLTLLSEWGGWHWTPPVTANGTTIPGSWYPGNFSLQLGGSGPPSAWGNWTYFGLEWISWVKIPSNVTTHGPCRPCQWAEFWAGSLPGTNYTGPNLTIHQALSLGGPSSPGPSGVAGLFSLISNVWVDGLLATVVLAVAISSLVVVRRRASRPPPQSGPPARAEAEVRSGTPAAVLGQLPNITSRIDAQQDTSLESSDPLNDAF
jgi:hypothetical protein